MVDKEEVWLKWGIGMASGFLLMLVPASCWAFADVRLPDAAAFTIAGLGATTAIAADVWRWRLLNVGKEADGEA
jgi:hypothetical protein